MNVFLVRVAILVLFDRHISLAICISDISFLDESNINAGRVSADAEGLLNLRNLGVQAVLGLRSDDEQPVHPPVVIVHMVALWGLVLGSQLFRAVSAFEDQVFVLACLEQLILELDVVVFSNQLQVWRCVRREH